MSDSSKWDLRECLAQLITFRDERDWKRFHTPKDLAAALNVEAAELQEIFLWQPAHAGSDVRKDADQLARAREEIADCAIYLLLLSYELELDLAAAIREKILANEKRYTVEEHRGVARKAPKRP